MKVAFLSKHQLLNNKNEIINIIEFRSKNSKYFNGNERCIENYEKINIEGRK